MLLSDLGGVYLEAMLSSLRDEVCFRKKDVCFAIRAASQHEGGRRTGEGGRWG